MTATNVTVPRSDPAAPSYTSNESTPVWRVGALASVSAAAATELLAAAARAASVPLRVGGIGAHTAAKIGVLGFALPTLMCSAIGTVLAIAIARRAKRPAHTFAVIAIVLTALSLISPALAGATTVATKTTLVAAHLLAAAIVIPALFRRLARQSHVAV